MIGFRYHEAAEAEYHDAIRHYSRISEDLGFAFVNEVETSVEHIRQFPEAHTPIGAGLRRCRVNRFRHAIIYEVQEDGIFIWAVIHTSRKPGYWKGRLE